MVDIGLEYLRRGCCKRDEVTVGWITESRRTLGGARCNRRGRDMVRKVQRYKILVGGNLKGRELWRM
jgi:hypothetical protein